MQKFIILIVLLILLSILSIFTYELVLDVKKTDLSFAVFNFKINYIFIVIPINILSRVFIVSTILSIYFILNNINLSYLQLLKISKKAEYIYIFPIFYEIFYFKFIEIKYDLNDLNDFRALSLSNYFDSNIDLYLKYPLTFLNLFDLLHIVLLSFFISKIIKTNFTKGLKVVAFSYIPALFIWIVLVMFFTLNYS